MGGGGDFFSVPHLRWLNGGLDDLQCAVDVGISVGVMCWGPAEVKDHQFVFGRRQLEEGLQAANTLFSRLQPLLCSQRAGCAEWIVLHGTHQYPVNTDNRLHNMSSVL